MKTTTKKRKQTAETKRTNYTTDHREKAKRYYLMGLSLQEISKLLDGASIRTLEKWQASGKWTETKEIQPIKEKALELYEGGRSTKEIAEMLKINRVTVWRYCKQAKEARQSK